MNWLALLCSLGLLTACSTVPIPDPMTYLAHDVGGHIQTVNDPLGRRRYDYGHYQETDCYTLNAKHAVCTWDYAPFGTLELSGDGGEQYVVDGSVVRIEGTRDGGTPYDQYFVGNDCGGTGWIVFKNDADSSWREVGARLSIAQEPGVCPDSLNQALTRYTRKPVTFPALGVRDTIVSEHYNSGSLNDAQALERSFFVAGVGRIAWQAFAVYPSPLPADELARRCPDFGWQTAGNLHLGDCRISDQFTPTASEATGAQMWRLGGQR